MLDLLVAVGMVLAHAGMGPRTGKQDFAGSMYNQLKGNWTARVTTATYPKYDNCVRLISNLTAMEVPPGDQYNLE